MNKLLKNKSFLCGLFLAVGIFAGWLIFGSRTSTKDADNEHIHAESEAQVWTCSMHPQIRQDKSGKCPLCAMDLIPLKISGTSDASLDPDAIQLSEEAAALANIQTTVVSRANPVKEIRLYGTVKPDERLLRSLVSHVSGRIEKLAVNYAGENVREGQVVASIYSPDLLNAQQELLEAGKLASTQPALLAAAREKLRHLKLTDAQIAETEQSGKASPTIDITANASGTVTAKRVEQGSYVGQGETLFDLADLSSVWAVFDAYESDLPYLKTGDRVEYTLQTLPGRTFSGKIAFIDPILDKTTRTVKIRVETSNPKLELKPEMYANAVIRASLNRQGDEIVIPKSAVLWTGKRSIIYVKQPDTDIPAFRLREIELGASTGNEYVVLSGVEEGEEIVTNGAFTIDASAQLEGKPSMMNMDKNGKEAEITAQGLCGMCKQRIETAAKSVNGVHSAVWDDETKQLNFTYDEYKTSPDAVEKAVAKSGHDTDKYKADDSVYDALPGCCKYRDE